MSLIQPPSVDAVIADPGVDLLQGFVVVAVARVQRVRDAVGIVEDELVCLAVAAEPPRIDTS